MRNPAEPFSRIFPKLAILCLLTSVIVFQLAGCAHNTLNARSEDNTVTEEDPLIKDQGDAEPTVQAPFYLREPDIDRGQGFEASVVNYSAEDILDPMLLQVTYFHGGFSYAYDIVEMPVDGTPIFFGVDEEAYSVDCLRMPVYADGSTYSLPDVITFALLNGNVEQTVAFSIDLSQCEKVALTKDALMRPMEHVLRMHQTIVDAYSASENLNDDVNAATLKRNKKKLKEVKRLIGELVDTPENDLESIRRINTDFCLVQVIV